MPKPPKPQLSTPEFIALFSLITSLTAVSIDAVLPALDAMGRALNVDDANDTQLIVTMFILGAVFGDLVFGPVSDAIGRKGAILIGLGVFAVGTVVAMNAASIEHIVAGRIIQGIGVSGPKIASRALIRDLYEGEAMARIMSFIFVVFIVVPMVAPAMGQLMLAISGWQAIFVWYLVFSVVIALWLGARQPETLAPDRRIRFSVTATLRNTLLIVGHARVMAYTAAAGLVFGALLLYLSLSQAVFVGLYETGQLFPMYFAVLAGGIGVAAFLNGKLVMRHGMHRLSTAALAGLILFSAALLIVALAEGGVPPFPLFMTLCLSMFFCVGVLFGNLNAMAMVSLGRVAGLGASVVSSLSSLIAVVLSVSVGRLYDDTIVPLAAGFLLAGMVAFALLLAVRKIQHRAI